MPQPLHGSLSRRSSSDTYRTAIVPGIGVGPLGKQHLDYLELAAIGSDYQRGGTFIPLGIDVGPLV
jgi:hypothetical protein